MDGYTKIKNLTTIYYDLEKIKAIYDSGIDVLYCVDESTSIKFLDIFKRFAVIPEFSKQRDSVLRYIESITPTDHPLYIEFMKAIYGYSYKFYIGQQMDID